METQPTPPPSKRHGTNPIFVIIICIALMAGLVYAGNRSSTEAHAKPAEAEAAK